MYCTWFCSESPGHGSRFRITESGPAGIETQPMRTVTCRAHALDPVTGGERPPAQYLSKVLQYWALY